MLLWKIKIRIGCYYGRDIQETEEERYYAFDKDLCLSEIQERIFKAKKDDDAGVKWINIEEACYVGTVTVPAAVKREIESEGKE